jgi:hypothetical protein
MRRAGDPAVLAHLEQARLLYEDAGAVEYVHEVVRETWRANRLRWSPWEHFDDANTLGHQTSRNVNNRMFHTFETSAISTSVLLETELGVVILGLGGFRLRVVKAPIESGLAPDFDNDFVWDSSATRSSAARRNSNNYYPFALDDGAFEFDDDPRPRHRRHVEACRDLFLVWAAELSSDRTAGWLGLPRVGDSPWMGAIELWCDEPEAHDAGEDAEAEDD